MEVIIRPNAEMAVELVSRLIENQIKIKPDSVLGLATGRTMERVYERLANGSSSFEHCTTFNLDEYVDLPPDNANSYQQYMRERFFSKININQANTHVPDGNAEDLNVAALQYEQLIEQAGGIDTQLLGIGVAGHIGFNEPLSSIMSRTRAKSLTEQTREQNAVMFGYNINNVPKRAITMGVGTILDARELILLAIGNEKAAILAKAVEGPITSMVSASAIQLHPNCKVIVDKAAAQALKGSDYYHFVFANEPEWAPFREDTECS